MHLVRAVLVAISVAFPAAAEVTVFAAASLKTALDEIAAGWEEASGHRAVVAYGGSAAMARQIIAGAPADVFVPAAPEWMDAVEKAGLVRKGSRLDLVGNRLVLIAQGDAEPVALDGLDLAGLLQGGRLAMGLVEAVPAGQYGREALQSLGLWDGVSDRLAEVENVRIALQLVARGEAPLGIVFASDAVAEAGVTVIATFPETSHRSIIYPAAIMADGGAEAGAFMDYLTGPEADAVFAKAGFLPVAR